MRAVRGPKSRDRPVAVRVATAGGFDSRRGVGQYSKLGQAEVHSDVSKKTTPVIVAIVACVVCVLGWVSLPSLQSAQRRVDAQAAEHLERARRMLNEYSFGLMHKAALLNQAEELGMDAEEENGAWIADEEADNYQADHERLWEGYNPTDWPDDPTSQPRPARANYGNLSGQIREGLASRAKIIRENEQLLDGALGEIGNALSITDGSVDSRSYAEANRLKAVILYHQGLADSIRARLKRNEVQPLRDQLVDLRSKVEWLKVIEQDNRIDLTNEKITELQNKAVQAKAHAAEVQGKLDKIDNTIADFKGRISQAKKTRDARFAEIQSLRSKGVDFSNPDGSKVFAQQYESLDRAYRMADRTVQTLEGGDFPKAQIDASADFIQGQYLENGDKSHLTVALGLSHYQQQREVLSQQASAAQDSVNVFEEGIQTLEDMLARFSDELSEARKQLPDLSKTAGDLYDDLSRLDDEAFALEDSALASLRKSATAANQAANNALSWVSDARTKAQLLTGEAKSLSPFESRTKDGWMAGHITAQEADAKLEQARIYMRRYRTQQLNAAIMADLGELLNLSEADAQDELEAAMEAQKSGIEAVKVTMARLQKAHKEANRHWTFVAHQAAANELLAQLDQPGYDKEALTGYRNAIKGRETESFSSPFQARIHQLENN